MENSSALFQTITPGKLIGIDGTETRIPTNLVVGENTKADSSLIFKNFFSKLAVGLKVGSNVTFFRTSLATEPNGSIEIGDYCFIANASIISYSQITIGNYVYIAGGVTIVDSDFHPIDPAMRFADTLAISTMGKRDLRPFF